MNRINCQLPLKILLAVIVLLPLVWQSNLLSIFEGAKVQFFTIGVDLVLVASLFCREQKRSKYSVPIVISLILFLGAAVFSSLFNGTGESSLWGNVYRSDGLWTLLHTILFSFLIAQYYQDHQRPLILSLMIPLAILTIWAVAAWLFPYLDLPRARWPEGIALTLGNPNILSGYLAVALPTLFYIVSSRNKAAWLWTIALLLVAGVVFISFINGSWGGLVTASAFIFLSLAYRYKWARILGVVMIPLVAAGAIYFYNTEIRRATERTELPVEERRERIYMKAAIAIREKPIIGWGWAQFAPVFQQIDWPTHYQVDAKVDRAHSFLLDVGVSTGLLGLILIVAVSLLSARRLYSTRDPASYAVWMMLVLYLIHSQTNVTSIAEDMFFYFAVGAAMSPKRINS